MNKNFRNEDLEEFLQNQLRNHRLYPNDNVWRNIHDRLHGETKWPALTVMALLLLSITAFIILYFSPNKNLFTVKPITKENLTGLSSLHAQNDKRNISLNHLNNNPIKQNSNPVDRYSDAHEDASLITENQLLSDKQLVISAPSATTTIQPSSDFEIIKNEQRLLVTENAQNTTTNIPKTLISVYPTLHNHSTDENHLQQNNIKTSLPVKNSPTNPVARAINKTEQQKKWGFQLYITPSRSFRIMKEEHNIQSEETAGPVALNYIANVNKIVRHKPGTGIEAGFSFLYNTNSGIRIKSGLQFNMRQYNIEAYRSSTELVDIALSNGNRFDTISMLAMYRTSNGLYSTDLKNKYYQISIPVGLEVKVFGNNKIEWNIAGTIQPTYLLNRNAYMISSDYKNYTESPEMVRRWNINSNLETFISFKSRGFKWQIGPQVRYQPYSTFIKQYSIKENLLDYGIKIGVASGL